MSDETPTGETEPAATPAAEPAPPSEPAAPSAEAVAPEAAAANPVTAEPVTAETVTPEQMAAEPVTEAAPPPPTAEPTAVPVAPVGAPPPERRGGILLPTWVAILVAVLLIGGIGFAIGYMTGDDDGADSANASSSQVTPNGGTSNGNNGNNNNGNDNNGNDNNGNGNGQTAAPIAFLGVELESAPDNGGAQISSVRENSPAADAGLKSGDVVTKIDDTTVADDDDLIRAIRSHDPGDDVTVTYTRDGNTAQAEVTLGDRSEATRSSVAVSP